MNTNHNWNVINIMRYFNRRGISFTAETYSDFMYGPVNLDEIKAILRRYSKNKWIVRAGDGYVATDRGTKALRNYEQSRKDEFTEQMRENGRKTLPRKTVETVEKTERKRNKYGTFTK